MKTKLHINRLDNKLEIKGRLGGKRRRAITLLGAAVAGVLLAAQSVRADDGWAKNKHNDGVGDIFVIALENHNFTQPGRRQVRSKFWATRLRRSSTVSSLRAIRTRRRFPTR